MDWNAYAAEQRQRISDWCWQRFPNQPVRIALMMRILNVTRY